ncbi:MAG: glycosyltransferase family 39 protein [Candidatus Omnitrophota bacterium]
MVTNKSSGILLIILLIFISFLLRIWHIDWGLPYIHNHDELNHIEQSLQVGSGKLEPQGLMHGTLITYLLSIEYGILYILGKIIGRYLSTDGFLLSYLTDPTIFFIIGRVTIVLLSVGSIFVTYLIGKKLFNERVGIISALFIAFSPTHFINSTCIKDDIPATFFCTLFFYFTSLYLLADNSTLKRNRFYYASGFFLGLAIAAKLTAIPGIVTFCLAFSLKELSDSEGYKKYLIFLWDRRFLKGMLFVLTGFFIADPYAVINYKKFIYGILFMKNQYMENVITVKNTQIFYFTNHLPDMIGIPLTIFFCISVIYFVFKPSNKLILLLSFPAVYYLIFNKSTGFAHHILTALPFIVILISVFLDKIYFIINKWNMVKSAVVLPFLLILFITPEALNTIRYIYVLGSADTRILAKKWIEDNIPSNKSIFIEGGIKNLIVLGPQLRGNLDTLKDDFNFVVSRGGSGKLQKLLINSYKDGGKTYMLYKASPEIRQEDIDKFNADYIITNGFVDLDVGELEYWRDEGYYIRREAVHRKINERYELIKQFKPFPSFSMYFPFASRDYNELKSINLFDCQKEIIPGPEIKIFKRKT